MQVLRAISMRKGIAKLKVFSTLLQDSPSLNDAALFFLQRHKQVAPGNLLLGLTLSFRVILLRFSVGCLVLEGWQGPVNATKGFKLSFVIY